MKERLHALGRHMPRIGWLSAAEALLLAVLAVQGARLLWAMATPVGSYGAWTGQQSIIPSPAARQTLFSGFDAFYRAAGPGEGSHVVTSLAITLFGIRVNEGSGLGSAIIATPDGVQNSFAVGEEILPGVVLKSVAFDHIVIDRGGAEENVFLDQSQAAPVAVPSASAALPSAAAAPGPGGADMSAAAIKSDIGLAPRMEKGRVTGLVLTQKGPAFQTAGFIAGDIVTQVNGRVIGSATDLSVLQGQIVPGARLSLMVERGGAIVPIALTLQGP